MRRKRTIIIAAAILLLVGAVLALPWIVNVDRYRGALETAARQRLHRDVTLGPIRLSVLPPGLRVEHASIGEDPSFPTGRPFARVREVYVSPKLLPLLRGRFELRAVELHEPEIELVRGASGWNVATLTGPESSSTDSQSSSSPDAPALVLNRLSITGGQIAVTDLRPGAGAAKSAGDRRAVYTNIDVQLSNFGPAREFEVAVGATLPGSGTQRVSVSGKAGPLVSGATAMTPFNGTAKVDQVSVADLRRYLALASLDGTDGTLSGSASLRNQQGLLSAAGTLQLDRVRVRDVVIGYPVKADFDIAHDSNRNLLTITKSTLHLDKTPVSLTGTVDVNAEPPSIDVHLTAADAPLAEAARLASAFGVAFGANTQVQGRASVDVRARGAASSPALDGSVRLRDVSIAGPDIPQPVRTTALDVALTPEAIRSNEFSVTTAGTTVTASAALAKYTTPKPVLDARVRTAGADLGDVLNAARAWGAGVDGLSGTGRLTLDVHASGPLDTLTYVGSGSLNDATLRAPSLAEPVRVRTAVLSFNRDAAVLEKLAAGLGKTSLDGRISIRSFASPRVDFQLAADRIDVGEMQRLLSAPDAAAAPGARPQKKPGKAGDSAFTRTTGSGSLRVGAVTYDRLLLEDVAATVTLDRGLVHLNPVTAAVYGGRHRGSIDVNARQTPTLLAIASTLEKVDANKLASSVTSLKDIVYGTLGATMRMTLSGDGAQSMARSLNGTLSIGLTDGRIANLNLRREIANAARFITGEPPSERSTRVAALSGSFDVKSGLARTDDLKATIEGGTLGATGTIDLADQRVDLRMTTVLSSEVSQKAGGSRVGGFMTTALANQQGELVVPLIVTGTMTVPRVIPDVQRVAEMKLKSLLPSLRDPQTLSSGILGAIGGSGQGGSRKTVNDIVGAVTGRSPQAPESPKEGGATPAPQPEAAKPEEKKDTVKEVEDAIRDLLRRRKPQEKPPDPPPTQPKQ